MRIVEGVYQGKSGDIVKSVTGKTVIRVAGKKYSFDKDIKRFKQLSKSEERTFGQLLICILLAFTLIGLPIAALLLFVWKKITWSAGCETNSGERFILQSDSRKEYNLARKFLGLGSIQDF